MGFLGKASDFFAAAGASTGSFIGDALHNVSNYACQLHYNTPGVIFDISPFNRELWKELCKDRPSGLPPAPASPYTGGQCDAVLYRVTITWLRKDGTTSTHSPGTFWGPIKSVEFVKSPLNRSDSRGDLQELWMTCRGSENSFQPLARLRISTQYTYATSIQSVAIVRTDGKSDNCGNVPPPAVQPVVLTREQRTTNINVVSVDQSTVNVVPIILDFPSASVDFDLSVPLKVTIDNRKFHLNIDGWYTGFPSPPVSLPDVEKILSDNVLQFEGALNQYFAPINPSINNNLVLVSPSAGKKKGGEEKDIPGAQWLIWDLTRLPDKAQYGENSPTVYFAGWFSFYKEGRCMERRQINYERGIVRFPDGADGYGYTFTNGAEGDVSVYKEKPQNG